VPPDAAVSFGQRDKALEEQYGTASPGYAEAAARAAAPAAAAAEGGEGLRSRDRMRVQLYYWKMRICKLYHAKSACKAGPAAAAHLQQPLHAARVG